MNLRPIKATMFLERAHIPKCFLPLSKSRIWSCLVGVTGLDRTPLSSNTLLHNQTTGFPSSGKGESSRAGFVHYRLSSVFFLRLSLRSIPVRRRRRGIRRRRGFRGWCSSFCWSCRSFVFLVCWLEK